MPRRTWLDSKIGVFLEELAASGMHLDRQRAGELITGQVRAVAALLRVTEATARSYLVSIQGWVVKCGFAGGVQLAVAGSHGSPARARVMASRAVSPWFAAESR